MRLKLTKNWVAKILSLLLATAIWFLIKGYLKDPMDPNDPDYIPKATPVREDK
jgi:hypothetical protein